MRKKPLSILLNSVVIVLGRCIEVITVIAGAILVARFLGVKGYGLFALIRTIGMSAMPFIGWGAFKILIRDISIEPDKTGAVLLSACLLNLFFAGLLSMGAWIFFIFVPMSDPAIPICVYFILISQTFAIMQKNFFAASIAFEKVILFSILQICQRVALLIMYAMVLKFGLDLPFLFMGMAFINFLSLLTAAWFVLLRAVVPTPQLRIDYVQYYVQYLVKESCVIMVSDLIHQSHAHINVFILKYLSTLDQITFFQLPQRILIPLQIIPRSVMLTIFPMFSQLGSNLESYNNLKANFKDIVNYLLIICLPFCAVLTIYAEKVITIFFGKEFSGATLPLQLCIWTFCTFIIVIIIEDLLIALKKQKFMTLSHVICLVINVISAFFLVPKYGAVGATEALMFGVFVQFIVLSIIMAHLFQIQGVFVVLVKQAMCCCFVVGVAFLMSSEIHDLILIPLSICIYIGGLWLLGSISRKELNLLSVFFMDVKTKIELRLGN